MFGCICDAHLSSGQVDGGVGAGEIGVGGVGGRGSGETMRALLAVANVSSFFLAPCTEKHISFKSF